MQAPARILVRWPNWLGDALMARPFLRGLRAACGSSRIMAIAPEGFLALLAGDGVYDEAVALRDRALDARVRAFGAEVAFVLPPSFSSAWFALRHGVPRRIGFRGDARDLLLTDAVARPARGELHLSREYLMLGRSFDVREPAFRPLRMTVGAAGAHAVRDALAGALVLAPGAAYGPAKRWPAERYVALGRKACAQGWPVVVCGAAEDREVAEAVAGAIGSGAQSLAGRTSLLDVAAALAGAGAVVSNDSGFAHLAAATGAPTVTIFGSTSSAWTAPLGAARILQHPPVCSPCFQRRCTIGTICLHAVGVDEVWAAVGEVQKTEGAGSVSQEQR
jgi:heptosyltransferase-2